MDEEIDINKLRIVHSNKDEEDKGQTTKKVYLPGEPMEADEELVYDPSAYVMLHEGQTGYPCLSFDIIPDSLGTSRDSFPLTTYLVAGTQAEFMQSNSLIVMKVSNLHKTLKEKKKKKKTEKEDSDSAGESSDEDSSESDEEEKEDEEDTEVELPEMKTSLIRHYGTVNRIRCTNFQYKVLAGVWSDAGRVNIYDIKSCLKQLDSTPQPKGKTSRKPANTAPLFSFQEHHSEGFAIDWSSIEPGVLASGDCQRKIFIWRPNPSTGWEVNTSPLAGHTASIEDLQWSPTEANVLASASVDKSIRIWDTRDCSSGCQLMVQKAHSMDVNVISWNRQSPALLASGGDEGTVHVWDLRRFKKGSTVATLKHHKGPVTSVEWHPTESSIFASSGEDDQVALWDLAVEKEPEEEATSPHLKELPPQLLFIHQGQKDIKELHWHPQVPGLLISTANNGFNFFKTISV